MIKDSAHDTGAYLADTNNAILNSLKLLVQESCLEKDMNAVSDMINSTEKALKKIKFFNEDDKFWVPFSGSMIGYNFLTKRILYSSALVGERPLIECKFSVRKDIINHVPSFLEGLKRFRK